MPAQEVQGSENPRRFMISTEPSLGTSDKQLFDSYEP